MKQGTISYGARFEVFLHSEEAQVVKRSKLPFEYELDDVITAHDKYLVDLDTIYPQLGVPPTVIYQDGDFIEISQDNLGPTLFDSMVLSEQNLITGIERLVACVASLAPLSGDIYSLKDMRVKVPIDIKPTNFSYNLRYFDTFPPMFWNDMGYIEFVGLTKESPQFISYATLVCGHIDFMLVRLYQWLSKKGLGSDEFISSIFVNSIEQIQENIDEQLYGFLRREAGNGFQQHMMILNRLKEAI